MIAHLAPTRSYRLSDDLEEPSATLAVRRVGSDEIEGEEILLEKLGPRGWGRIHHFRNYYQASWGERRGQAMSARALNAFIRFLSQIEIPAPGKRPSVFFTDFGGIEMCWESMGGKALQVEFRRDGVEFYSEATGEEGQVGLLDFDRLKAALGV